MFNWLAGMTYLIPPKYPPKLIFLCAFLHYGDGSVMAEFVCPDNWIQSA